MPISQRSYRFIFYISHTTPGAFAVTLIVIATVPVVNVLNKYTGVIIIYIRYCIGTKIIMKLMC